MVTISSSQYSGKVAESAMEKKSSNNKGTFLPEEVVFRLSKDQISTIYNWQSIELTCARCGLTYYEINNIGQWKCSQHARGWNDYMGGNFYGPFQWDCCGVQMSKFPHGDTKAGCVAADHSPLDIPYSRGEDDMQLPKDLLGLIKVKPESIVPLGDAKNTDIYEDLIDRPDSLSVEVTDENGEVISVEREEFVVVRRFDWNEDIERKSTARTMSNHTYVKGIRIPNRFISSYGIS